MKKLLIGVAASVVLVGCASSPYGTKAELKVEKKVYEMSRQQVINAITDCESAGMRPVLIMSKKRVNDFYVDIVLDVTCAPKPRNVKLVPTKNLGTV